MKNNESLEKLKICFIKGLIVVMVVIFGTLITNKSDNLKANIYENIYDNTISFAKIKKIYNDYAGVVIPFQNMISEKQVFNENIRYYDLSTFNNGIKLTLDNDYPIPIIKDGIVVFIGEKDDLNKTVVIEDEDGVDIMYGNLDKVNVKLYDYVKENDLLGEAYNNSLYLVFKKGDEYLDYKKFLK